MEMIKYEKIFINNLIFNDEYWCCFAPNVGLVKKVAGEGPTLLLNSYEF
jgi:hypothetical protein